MGLVELIVLLVAVSGSVWIVGMAGWLWHRIKRLEDNALGRDDTPKALLAEIEQLKEALNAGDQERERLNERLEFLERLLSTGEKRQPEGQQLPPGTEAEGTDPQRATE